MALIEFGDDAYVITPFTTDYENILLSTALIGDWNEFMAFPDQGTVVARAVEQAVGLFQAFDYLDAAGNLMVIFTDGADADVLENGKTVDDVLAEARRAKIPVYLIKIGGNIPNKRSVADELWIGAVKKTGGKFFSRRRRADDHRVDPRDRSRAAGKIEMKQYSTERPRYAPFALTAALLWCAALLLRFTVPTFQTFPYVRRGRSSDAPAGVRHEIVVLVWTGIGRDSARGGWRDPVAGVELEQRLAAAERDLVTLQLRERGGRGGAAAAAGWRSCCPATAGRRPTPRRSRRRPATGKATTTRSTENPEAKLLAANAAYRTIRGQGGTWQAVVGRLDSVVKQYAEILREDPNNTEAAFNYEYAVRLRAVIAARKQPVPSLDAAATASPSTVSRARRPKRPT